jgi:hypothetical protein
MKAPLLATFLGMAMLAALARLRSDLPTEVPAGTTVDGLQICLAADREVLRPGETVVVRTTLFNHTDAEMRVHLGQGTTNFIANGLCLRRIPEPAGGDNEVELAPPRPAGSPRKVSWFHRLAEPLIQVIPAWGWLEYATPLTLHAEYGRMFFPVGSMDENLPLEAPPGVCRFRVVYQSDNASIRKWDLRLLSCPMERKLAASAVDIFDVNFGLNSVMNSPASPAPPLCWEGVVRSNDVCVRILRRDGR